MRVAGHRLRLMVLQAAGGLCLAIVAGTLASPAAEPAKPAAKDFKDELPRIPPHSPAEALKTFTTLPGFHIEQVAAEPLVRDPVAMSFDENGRLFVVEMVDYSEQANDFLGTIRLLEDTDGDGRFDKSTIYVDQLSWPTAVTCYDGGVFVGAAPDIWYCKDTDGDGKADVKKVVFTGFGRGNVQGLFNSFQWGLDSRIHGATSSSGAQVRRAGEPSTPPIVLSGRDFSFDPRTLDFTPVSGGAQHGMSFDDWGRKFVCSNSDHIQLVMFEDRYIARNKSLAAPSARISIAADGPQAEVFRTSAVEPWRIVRTRLRMSGAVPGVVEGGGRAAGYFTGATGTTIYRGNAWPAEYRGQAFVGDVGSNIVHRKVLEPAGVGLIARRVDEGREFVASSDIWFRPAQFANAPDGTLYVADVYREVIEHPLSLPQEIKQHLDLTSGRDRGRIYRIVPDGFQQPALPRLGAASTAELVATLSHRNGWHRDTAARLLVQGHDPAAVPLLEKSAAASLLPEGRMQSLYVLQGLGGLSPAMILRGLKDESPQVRRHAIRLSEPVAAGSPEIVARLVELADDSDPLVRYQLAFTLGELHGPERIAALARLARRDGADRWSRLAILSSLSQGAGDVLQQLAADTAFRATPAGRDQLEQLAKQIGIQARQEDVAGTLAAIEAVSATDISSASALVRGLSEGLTQSGSPLKAQLMADGTKVAQLLSSLVAAARTTAADDKRPSPERADAVRTLALGVFADHRELLAGLLANRHPQEVQLAALAVLARSADPAVGKVLLEAWPTFGPRLRGAASEAIFSRGEWLTPFLEAVDKDEIPPADLEPARIKVLQKSSNPAIRALAEKLAVKINLGRRQDVLDAYQSVLTLKGDPERGRGIFRKTCVTCHRLEDTGHEIGANLATIKNRGADAILLNVLDPNREVNPQYVNYLMILNDGRTLTGMIAAETANSVTLKRAENMTDTVLRSEIEELRSSGLSIMPEGLEKDIPPQSMADLISYLLSVK